jgi:hypothetical protein
MAEGSEHSWLLPLTLLILVIGALVPTLYFLFVD